MKRARTALLFIAAALVVAVVWVAWQGWNVSRSLSASADDARSLKDALSETDQEGIERSLKALQEHASEADSRTGGTTWSVLAHLPVVGDDARGVRTVSQVLDDLSDEGFADLAESASNLEAYLPQDGRIPLDALSELRGPVSRAESAFLRADKRLSGEDPSGYVTPLKTNYEDLAARVADARLALANAAKALGLLPDMLGGSGPRNYLLVFQNNAEIRATGGLPGAWALITAVDGQLAIAQQGTAGSFPPRDNDPIIPLSPEELEIYGPQLGDYFQDANFTPDFPRTAELWRAWWASTFPNPTLDGVISFDPVGMSYLLAGTGPVQVGDVTLTPENAVEELLNKPYLTTDNAAQDAFFSDAAQSIFAGITDGLASPVKFLDAVQRASREERVHVTSFNDAEQRQLAGTKLEGRLPADDGDHPRVQITLNDATGSKMSYYLRFRASVDARKCSSGQQTLLGSMTLSQTIQAAAAAALPTDVTGGGNYGVAPGKQLVIIRIYSPTGGSIVDLNLDGRAIDPGKLRIGSRQVAIVVTELSGPDDVLLTWTATTGEGQTGDGAVALTPSVVPGTKNSTFKSAC